MLRPFVFLILPLLAACTSDPRSAGGNVDRLENPTAVRMKLFNTPPNRRAVSRSNFDISREILDLAFYLESGRELRTFTRFEGPVSISFRGAPPPTATKDLNQLVRRLRTEAGIDITVQPFGPSTNISVDFVNGNRMRREVPNAACFIVPGAASFDELLKRRRDAATDWSRITSRERVVVVIPDDAAPQEVRDCLHEEVAQALGPLNDLYRLADSVYNDDNFHLVLTPFDMLVLRVFYSPELRNGMTQTQVAARLNGILNRLNPAGLRRPTTGQRRTPDDWAEDVRAAVGPLGKERDRIRSINSALQKSRDYGFSRNRLGYIYFARGRLLSRTQQNAAIRSYVKSYELFKRVYGAEDIHTARASIQLISIALAAGDIDKAASLIPPSKRAARQAEDAGLLMNLFALEAEVARLSGKTADVARLRQEARAWGLYAIGNRREVEKILGITLQIGQAGAQNLRG